MVRPPRFLAFTLVELLVVMAIIATLAGLLLTGIPAARSAMLRARTAGIIAKVKTAIDTRVAQSGSIASPAPHPFAATAVPRSLFSRVADAVYTAGQAVDPTGECLEVGNPTWLFTSQAQGRVVLNTDVFQGISAAGDVPAFTGMARRQLTMLGSATGLVALRKLPDLAPWNNNGSNQLKSPPYDLSAYPDNRYLVATPGTDDDRMRESDRLLDLALGATKEDLTRLGAFHDERGGASYLGGRLRLIGPIVPRWKHGHLKVGSGWQRYRISGPALYDAWGQEILVYADAGRTLVVSAGKDGCFRSTPAGADAARDNLASSGE